MEPNPYEAPREQNENQLTSGFSIALRAVLTAIIWALASTAIGGVMGYLAALLIAPNAIGAVNVFTWALLAGMFGGFLIAAKVMVIAMRS